MPKLVSWQQSGESWNAGKHSWRMQAMNLTLKMMYTMTMRQCALCLCFAIQLYEFAA